MLLNPEMSWIPQIILVILASVSLMIPIEVIKVLYKNQWIFVTYSVLVTFVWIMIDPLTAILMALLAVISLMKLNYYLSTQISHILKDQEDFKNNADNIDENNVNSLKSEKMKISNEVVEEEAVEYDDEDDDSSVDLPPYNVFENGQRSYSAY